MTRLQDRLATALEGRYRIERKLGAGGMATVYLAEDLKHHRRVAIKVLRQEVAASLGSARFLREIEIAGRLQHPNILPMLDSGSADDLLFYVMPFVEGQSLRDRLSSDGRLPIAEALRLLTELSDALGYAHDRGVVHRDIKPDNVMCSGRHALVMDFGIARAVDVATGGHPVTSVGLAVGTPTYMAPEQATADPNVDHRADIYALGVMGYELLVGRPPFAGSTAQQLLAAQVTQVPDPVRVHRPELPLALESAIMRCLEKLPDDRWQSAHELLASLESIATPAATVGTVRLRVAPHRRTVAVAGILGVVALAVFVSTKAIANRNATAAAVTVGQSRQLTNDDGLELWPAISPDGKLVAYAGGTYARLRIFIKPVVGGRVLALGRYHRRRVAATMVA